MSYLSESLGPGEKVVATAKTHWIAFLPAAIMVLIGLWLLKVTAFPLIAAGIALLWAIVKKMTTELALTNRKVLGKWGVISRHSIEQRIDKVDSIEVVQSILGRMLDYGSILVRGAGVSATPISTIADPLAFRRAFESVLTGGGQVSPAYSPQAAAQPAPQPAPQPISQPAPPRATQTVFRADPAPAVVDVEPAASGAAGFYRAEINRETPTCIVFVVDQSHSMSDLLASGRSKAAFVADALNRTLYSLVTNCTKADGVRHYFDIGVIGYGGNGPSAGLGGALAVEQLYPIAAIADNPVRIENRTKSEDDGAGGIIERKIKFPVWFDAKNDGGTPMRAALARALKLTADWCSTHPRSYPPTIIHVTDGESTDGDPEEIAASIKRIGTSDGRCLLFNIHVSTRTDSSVSFPNHEGGLPDAYAQLLFRMSSVLPRDIAVRAEKKGYRLSGEVRGYVYNADPKDIVNFFDIGTQR